MKICKFIFPCIEWAAAFVLHERTQGRKFHLFPEPGRAWRVELTK